MKIRRRLKLKKITISMNSLKIVPSHQFVSGIVGLRSNIRINQL